MKRNVLFLASLVSIGSVASAAAQTNGADNRPQNLPPGLQRQGQLPPGLQKRDQLPPGLQRGAAQNNQLTLTNSATSLQQTVPRIVGDTNAGLTIPTGAGITNRLYPTNTTSLSNRTSVTIQDQAYTPADRQVLIQIRRAVLPLLGNLGQVSQAQGSAWQPVHFVVRDRVVNIVGVVLSDEQKQQIEATITQIPGVVRVVNQLRVNANSSTEVGSAGGAGTSLPSDEGTNAATAGFGGRSNVFGLNQTNSAFGTNGISATGTNSNRIYGTNQFRGTNNLSPTGRTNSVNRAYPNGTRGEMELPPGLQKRDQLPPGISDREDLPPGLRNR